jgi:low affinity Fe/Cu permease
MSPTRYHNGGDAGYRLSIIAAVVALAAIAAAIVIGGEIAGFDSQTTPVVTTALGFIATTVVALLALLQAQAARHEGREINAKVDGHISRLTTAAVNAGVKPEDLPPAPTVTTPTVPGQPMESAGETTP